MELCGQGLELAGRIGGGSIDVRVRVVELYATLLLYVEGEDGVGARGLSVHLGGAGGAREGTKAEVFEGLFRGCDDSGFNTGEVNVAGGVFVNASATPRTSGLEEVLQVLVVELEKLSGDLLGLG